jgi:hypothetical protein
VAGSLTSGGLPAGLASVAVLLALVSPLDASLLTAVLLAAGTYAGVAFLRSSGPARATAAPELIPQSMAVLVQVSALRRFEAQITKAEVREQVARICAGAERVAQAICEDEDQPGARLFNEQVLVPVAGLLTEYIRLTTRGVAAASDLIERVELQDLPLIEQAIDDIHERLHRSSLTELATMSELLELNLEWVVNAMSRRSRL